MKLAILRTARDYAIIGVSIIVWLAALFILDSFPFSAGLNLNPWKIHLRTATPLLLAYFLNFIAVIAPLSLALFWGSKTGRSRQTLRALNVIFAILFTILFGLMLFTLNDANADNKGKAIGMVVIASIAVPLLLQSFFVWTFFIAMRRLRADRFQYWRAFAVSVGVYLCAVLLLLGPQWYRLWQFERTFCTNENAAGGRYAQLFFLMPLTKGEIAQIVKGRRWHISHLMLARKPGPENSLYSWLYPVIGPQSVDGPLAAHLPRSSFVSDSSLYSPAQRALVDAYDANEAVVWFVQFNDAPMGDFVRFTRALDEQGRLGVLVSEGSYPIDQRQIRPQTPSHRIVQKECYARAIDEK